MTDHEAAKVLDAAAAEHEAWRAGAIATSAKPDVQFDAEAAACRRGAAALRQPRLPKEWPLKWRRGGQKDARNWMATMPAQSAEAWVCIHHDGRWYWWAGDGVDGTCTTAWAARRAAARAVARAVRASMGGGAK